MRKHRLEAGLDQPAVSDKRMASSNEFAKTSWVALERRNIQVMHELTAFDLISGVRGGFDSSVGPPGPDEVRDRKRHGKTHIDPEPVPDMLDVNHPDVGSQHEMCSRRLHRAHPGRYSNGEAARDCAASPQHSQPSLSGRH
jgi:hypothetical protein